ncbi:MAG: DUF2157 domain-containing protein [Rubrivivax sp.]
MDLRLTILDWAGRHRLDPAARRRLEALAGLGVEPAALRHVLPRALAALAAALAGLGVVFWIASQWGELGRAGRFGVLQGALLLAAAGAWPQRAARPAAGLLLMLGTGALFAFFGQTYQTGADAWQLFALWAALALPLALGLRSDLVWAPWVLVAVAAVSLWVQAHTGHRWRFSSADAGVQGAGWVMLVALTLALGPPGRRFTGAGPWALRTAATLTVAAITAVGLGGLFANAVGLQYALALVALAAAAALTATRRAFDVFVASALALGLDTLVVAGLGRLLLEGHSGGDPIGRLFLLGLVAAGLLAASVKAVLHLARRAEGEAR